MSNDKLTKAALFSIKPGAQKVFVLAEPKKVVSAKSYISRLNVSRDLPQGVRAFTYTTNLAESAIAITAEPNDGRM